MSSTDLVPTTAGLISRTSLHKMLSTPQLPPVNIHAPVALHEGENARIARLAVLIPAYNEEKSIGAVLTAILSSTRLPEVVLVVVNGTTDMTLEVIEPFLGRHTRRVRGVEFETEVFVHDMGAVKGKVNALNEGYRLLGRGQFDYIVGIDGDTIIAPDCIEKLEEEAVGDSRIGGLSALYTCDYNESRGAFGKFLIAGQRATFASFSMDNLLRNRNMAVLGGQCSVFNVKALEAVREEYKQGLNVWSHDSEVEDSLLSLQIKKVGYSTKISASARATVGSMTTFKSLAAQQTKWLAGALQLMRENPFHPNLRLRWRENISAFFNATSRFAFLMLLAAALSLHAFIFNPIWLIPPVVGVLLNIRVALSMKDKNWKDLAFAATVIPAETYMWIRIGHTIAAWVQHFGKVERDNWGAQAAAENGRGGRQHLFPIFIAFVVVGLSVFAWQHMSVNARLTSLELGWPVLFVVTIVQALFMIKRLGRRQKGFLV